MCDIGIISSLAIGAVQAAGASTNASKNKAMIRRQEKLDHARQSREYIVQSNAANKEAYKASLEADRAKAYITARSSSMGSSAGARIAEQARQGSLSIANARDRSDAAMVNQIFGGVATSIQADHKAATTNYDGFDAFTTIAGAGFGESPMHLLTSGHLGEEPNSKKDPWIDSWSKLAQAMWQTNLPQWVNCGAISSTGWSVGGAASSDRAHEEWLMAELEKIHENPLNRVFEEPGEVWADTV